MVVQLIGIALLMISIVVQCNAIEIYKQCIGLKLLMINSCAIYWDCIAYDKHSCAMYWDCIAYDKHSCAMYRDWIAYDKHRCAIYWDALE